MRLVLALLTALAVIGGMLFLARDLLPPDRVTFAAGTQGGGYWKIAERYRVILAQDGIEVELIETNGAVENAKLLQNGEAEVGILQGGVSPREDTAVSLGAIFYEPVLVFGQPGAPIPQNPAFWTGLRIGAGPEGSGARAATVDILTAAGVPPGVNEMVAVGSSEALSAVIEGDVDIAVFAAPLNAPYLQSSDAADRVELVQLAHMEAISRHLPQSRVVTLPDGAMSLNPVRPPEPTDLLVLLAELTAVPDLHPAVVDRLVNAARIIHGDRDVIAEEGEFPSATGTSVPMSSYATQAIQSAPNALDRLLPYWAAAQIDQVIFLFLPLLFLLPLMRILPGVYGWSLRRRVWKFYRSIREVEDELTHAPDAETLAQLDARMAELDQRVSDVSLPNAFRKGAYDARLHIDLVRKQISKAMEATK